MKVGLLVTGRMEAEGLPLFLQRLFPEHSFYSITQRGDGTPFDSFTSSPIGSDVPTNLTKIIQALCAELIPGRGEERPDFLFVLDDLEIANLVQPACVTQRFVEAVRLHIDTYPVVKRRAELEAALQERASFHLAVPMIESWLFAGEKSLVDAGVPYERLPPQLANDTLLEDFFTSDQAFSLDKGCAMWTDLTEEEQKRYRKNRKPLWLIEDREKHPKAYISWLCRNENEKKCSTYKESGGNERDATGSKALAFKECVMRW